MECRAGSSLLQDQKLSPAIEPASFISGIAGDRTRIAVADSVDAGILDPGLHEVSLHSSGTVICEDNIFFMRAARIGMSFNTNAHGRANVHEANDALELGDEVSSEATLDSSEEQVFEYEAPAFVEGYKFAGRK